MASARYRTVGPLYSGAGSRAQLAIALAEGGGAPEPRVLIPLHADVLASEEALALVRRETARAVDLEHPHITRVFGLSQESIGLCRVVEYADAESVRGLLDLGGPMDPGLAVRIAADAALGVHYAHLAGNDDGTPLVHGDLRPETLLVTYTGITKVGGYGALAAAPREQKGRRVRGRRQHCAPEQIIGGRQAVSVRSDVYLLGVLLHELLSGEVPFAQLGQDFDHAVLALPPPPLPVGERPPGLEPVIHRAMAKKAGDRYPSALAFREALEQAVGAFVSHELLAAHVARVFPATFESRRAVRTRMLNEALERAGGNALVVPLLTPTGRPAVARPTGGKSTATVDVPAGVGAQNPAPPPGDPGARTGDDVSRGDPPAAPGAPGATTAGQGAVAATSDVPAPHGTGAALPSEGPAHGTAPVTAGDPLVPGRAAASPAVLPTVAKARRSERRSAAVPLALGALVLLAVGGGHAWVRRAEPASESPPSATVEEATDAGAAAAIAPAPDAGPTLAILDLFVDPPVDVSVDGEPAGRTPVKLRVAPGRRQLWFSDRARGISTGRVVDVPLQGAARQFYLSRGFINVFAPEGSQVEIDGRPYGAAPLREVGLFEGHHRLVVTIDEAKWQESFQLEPNQRLRFDVDFR